MAHHLTNLSKIVRNPTALNINRCGKYLQHQKKKLIDFNLKMRKTEREKNVNSEINSPLNHMGGNKHLSCFDTRTQASKETELVR